MPYRGSRDVVVNDFDGYDTTPYSGGYDLSLTYGRPLQPSDETCYPVSATGDVDFVRPQYSSGSQTSSFETNNALKGDCYGLLGLKSQPAYSLQPQPQPDTNTGYPGYGHQSYGQGGGGVARFPYGSVYAGRSQLQEYGSAYGQGYVGHPRQEYETGRKPQYGLERGSAYGQGYVGHPSQEYETGRKPQYGPEYGSGYGRQEGSFGYNREETKRYGEEGYGSSGYWRPEEEGYGRQGSGGNEYRRSEESAGTDGRYRRNDDNVYGGKTSYKGPSYGVCEDESDKYMTSGYPVEGSGGYKKSSYGDESQSIGDRKPSYYVGEECRGYGSSKYGNDSDDEEKKHSYHKHHHRQ